MNQSIVIVTHTECPIPPAALLDLYQAVNFL